MYEGYTAALQMLRSILAGEETDERIYHCTVIKYEEGREEIHMVLEDGELACLSLDAVYRLGLMTRRTALFCRGMVKERFTDRRGNVVIFRIENGFYKNNLNS